MVFKVLPEDFGIEEKIEFKDHLIKVMTDDWGFFVRLEFNDEPIWLSELCLNSSDVESAIAEAKALIK